MQPDVLTDTYLQKGSSQVKRFGVSVLIQCEIYLFALVWWLGFFHYAGIYCFSSWHKINFGKHWSKDIIKYTWLSKHTKKIITFPLQKTLKYEDLKYLSYCKSFPEGSHQQFYQPKWFCLHNTILIKIFKNPWAIALKHALYF